MDWQSVPLSEMVKRKVRTVAVVPTASVPDIQFKTYAVKMDPSQLGDVPGPVRGNDPYEAVLLAPILAPIMIFSVIDIIYRASDKTEALPADVAQLFESAMSKDVAGSVLQEKLAEQVVAAGTSRTSYAFHAGKRIDPPDQHDKKPNYRLLSSDRADMAIETGVQRIWFRAYEGTDPKDPEISLYMEATLRIFWPADGIALPPGAFLYVSRPHKASEWARDNCGLLRQEIETAYAASAEGIIEKQFILYDKCGPNYFQDSEHLYREACALKAYAPSSSQSANSFSIPGSGPFQPTLAWEAFPGSNIKASDSPEIWEPVSDITYDLKVFSHMKELIYERPGLTAPERTAEIISSQPETGLTGQAEPAASLQTVRTLQFAGHTIETKLEPFTKYCWTVRAHFKIDGHVRTTMWSPPSDEFCFRTPEFQVAGQTAEDPNKVSEEPSPSLAALLPDMAPQYTASEQVIGKTFHTKANIWHDDRYQVASTNFHHGTILPIGSKVRIEQIVERTTENDPLAAGGPSIRFVDDNDRTYTMIFKSRHAADDMTIRDLFSQYFTENDPMAEGGVFSALTPAEQQNVKLGEIMSGMSKAAVLMSYGFPPSHKTPFLENNKWIYWIRGRGTKTVYFINDKVAHVQTR